MVNFPSLLALGGLLFSPSALGAVISTGRDQINNYNLSSHGSEVRRRAVGDAPTTNLPFTPSGNDQPSLNIWSAAEREEFERGVAGFGQGIRPNDQRINIRVHYVVHYLDRPRLRVNGYIAQADILASLAQLNRDYAQHVPKITFQIARGTNIGPLSGIQYKPMNKTSWDSMIIDSPRTQADVDKLTLLTNAARGPFANRTADQYQRLYIYLVNKMPSNQVAFAFLPQSNRPFPYDGIYYSQEYFQKTYPNAKSVPHALSHEVGHWLSLRHTFETPCDSVNSASTGDRIADTAPWTQSSNYYANICPIYATLEPPLPYDASKIVNPCGGSQADAIRSIDNIMSYSFGQCGTIFTPEQQARQWNAATIFRGLKPSCELA